MRSEDVLPLQAFFEVALMLAMVLPAVHLDGKLLFGEGDVDPESAVWHGSILSLSTLTPTLLHRRPENILRQRAAFLSFGVSISARLSRSRGIQVAIPSGQDAS